MPSFLSPFFCDINLRCAIIGVLITDLGELSYPDFLFVENRKLGGEEMKLIFGLGNPGKKYEKTKHNIGFDAVDRIAQNLGLSFNQTKFKSIYAEGRVGSEKVILIKPQTFMNLSGESIQPWLDFYKLTGDDMLIIYDDMDLPAGDIRLRMQGGSGGHKGVESTIQHLGHKNFNRIRFGVGRPYPGQTVVSHVLTKFPKEEEENIDFALNDTTDAVKHWLNGNNFQKTMNKYN